MIVSCSDSARALDRPERPDDRRDAERRGAATDAAEPATGAIAGAADRVTGRWPDRSGGADEGDERVRHRHRRRRTIVGIDRHRLPHQAVDCRIESAPDPTAARGAAVEPACVNGCEPASISYITTPERVDVGPLAQGGPGHELLGRHVAGRADQRVIARLVARNRNPEIGDPDLPFVVDEHVGGLEIAVQDAARMRGREPGAQLTGDVDDLLGGQAGPTRRRSFAKSSP